MKRPGYFLPALLQCHANGKEDAGGSKRKTETGGRKTTVEKNYSSTVRRNE